MSIKHAVLGLLIEKPSYAYEASVRLERLIGAVWQLNRAQVYQEFKRLEHERLIEHVSSSPNAHGQRRTYRVTKEGKKVYRLWRERKPLKKKGTFRDELLLLITLASEEDAEEVLEAINIRYSNCAELVQEFGELDNGTVSVEDASSWNEAGQPLSVKGAIIFLSAEMKWLAVVRETVERLIERGENKSNTSSG